MLESGKEIRSASFVLKNFTFQIQKSNTPNSGGNNIMKKNLFIMMSQYGELLNRIGG